MPPTRPAPNFLWTAASGSYNPRVARPREFVESEVLDRALSAFWARGYDATSIEDLVTATGLGRASLYGAFGDKEQLFRKVAERYLERAEQAMDAVTQGLAPREAVLAFLRSRANEPPWESSQPGCFLQMCATTGTTPPLVRDLQEATGAKVVKWLVEQLTRAQAKGELHPDENPAALASFLAILVSGLTASARAGVPRQALDTAIAQAMEKVFGAS